MQKIPSSIPGKIHFLFSFFLFLYGKSSIKLLEFCFVSLFNLRFLNL